MEPRIIKESSRGYDFINIEDEMLMNRKIECVGEINSSYINSLIKQFMYLESIDPDKEIILYINSPGGSVDAGMALYDVMKTISCPVHTVCMGLAASMGALLFISGDTRDMYEHSRVMIHDPLIKSVGGSALSLKSISDDLMETREIIAKVMANHTGKSLEEIYSKTSSDTFFRAEDALEFGLCDKIIKNKIKGEQKNEKQY